MKKICQSFLISALIILSSCGYKVQGMSRQSTSSILGNGDKTVAITSVEDPSLFPWVSYYVTNQFHSEMDFRKLAKWTDKAKADYTIDIIFHRFESRASLNDESDRTLLNSIYIEVEVIVTNTKDHTTWTSGIINGSEYYNNINEEQAVKDNINELIYSIFNTMENSF